MRGFEIALHRKILETEHPDSIEHECNIKAPENKQKRQKIFMISQIDLPCIRLLFKAYNISDEILTEM